MTELTEEERWCAEQRAKVVEYLRKQGLRHGRVGEWPAWHVEEIVSIWAIESVEAPGSVGWWAIAGDLPTDYVTVASERHPRRGLRDICERWLEVASYMKRGESHPTIRLGDPTSWPKLHPLLESRARALLGWADRDELWAE
jgi:hypothetical protein